MMCDAALARSPFGDISNKENVTRAAGKDKDVLPSFSVEEVI